MANYIEFNKDEAQLEGFSPNNVPDGMLPSIPSALSALSRSSSDFGELLDLEAKTSFLSEDDLASYFQSTEVALDALNFSAESSQSGLLFADESQEDLDFEKNYYKDKLISALEEGDSVGQNAMLDLLKKKGYLKDLEYSLSIKKLLAMHSPQLFYKLHEQDTPQDEGFISDLSSENSFENAYLLVSSRSPDNSMQDSKTSDGPQKIYFDMLRSAVKESDEEKQKLILHILIEDGYLKDKNFYLEVAHFLACNSPKIFLDQIDKFPLEGDEIFEIGDQISDPEILIQYLVLCSLEKKVDDIASRYEKWLSNKSNSSEQIKKFQLHEFQAALILSCVRRLKSAIINDNKAQQTNIILFLQREGYLEDRDFSLQLCAFLAENSPELLCDHIDIFSLYEEEILEIGLKFLNPENLAIYLRNFPQIKLGDMVSLKDQIENNRKRHLGKSSGGVCFGHTLATIVQKNSKGQDRSKIDSLSRFIQASHAISIIKHCRYNKQKIGKLVLEGGVPYFPSVLAHAAKLHGLQSADKLMENYANDESSLVHGLVGETAYQFWLKESETSSLENASLSKAAFSSPFSNVEKREIPERILKKLNIEKEGVIFRELHIQSLSSKLKELATQRTKGEFELAVRGEVGIGHAIYVSFDPPSFSDINDRGLSMQPKLRTYQTVEEMALALCVHLELSYYSFTEASLTEYKSSITRKMPF